MKNLNPKLKNFFDKLKPWLVTTVAVFTVGYIKLYFNHALKIDSPILLFFCSVALSAWYGGFTQGLFANLLSVAFILNYFVPLKPESLPHIWMLRLFLFSVDCLVISWVCAKMNWSKIEAQRSAKTALLSEERLRKVFESNMIGLVFSDFSGKMLDANDYFLKLVGGTRAELERGELGWPQFTPSEHMASGMKALRDLKEIGYSAPFEKEYLRKDGTRIFVSVGASRLDDSTIVAYVLDIHDRKLTETALAESKEQLERNVELRTAELKKTNEELSRLADQFKVSQSFLDSVVEHIPNMIFVKEAKDLTFVRFNKAGEKLLGRSREEFLGKNDFDFFPKEQALFFTEKDRDVLASNAIVDIPEEYIDTGIGTRVLHTKKIPLFDKEGNAQYLLGISEDITDKKAAEKQKMDLIQSEAARFVAEKSAAQLEFLSEASTSLNKSLDIHYMLSDFGQVVTDRMASICLVDLCDEDCITIERVIMDDQPLSKLGPSRLFEKINVNFEKTDGIGAVLKFGKVQIFNGLREEFLVENLSLTSEKAKEILSLGLHSVLMVPLIYYSRVLGALTLFAKREKGRFDEVDVSIAQDLSKRASIAIENSKLFSKANEASRAKSAFLANISHEIRTPLGAMLGFAELSLGTGKLEEPEQGYISKIAENGQQLLRLVDEVLDLSKAESDRIQIELIPFNLEALLADVASVMNLRANEKGLRLSLNTTENVPEFIKSDPLRLRQILLNIIGNAIKFTESGAVEVSADYDRQKKMLEFSVVDTGIGLSLEQASRLFAPFMQADESMTRKFGGTGLGLFLSRKLARLLGGDLILAKSSPEKGSQFKITVHTEEVNGLGADPTLSVPVKRGNVSQLMGRVLVVEDSLDNQILLKAFLSKMNMSVDIADNGIQGVAMALKNGYDIILMDIQMPKMDGFEAIKTLRDKGYHGRVVALTAHAMKGDRERCLEKGFDDYLCKPISKGSLTDCLSLHLS